MVPGAGDRMVDSRRQSHYIIARAGSGKWRQGGGWPVSCTRMDASFEPPRVRLRRILRGPPLQRHSPRGRAGYKPAPTKGWGICGSWFYGGRGLSWVAGGGCQWRVGAGKDWAVMPSYQPVVEGNGAWLEVPARQGRIYDLRGRDVLFPNVKCDIPGVGCP